MKDDPIMAELRKAKEDIAKKYNYDLRRMAKALNEEAIRDGCVLVDSSSSKSAENQSETEKSAAVVFLEQLTGGPLTFCKMLHSIRLCENMTQTQFAKKLQISPYSLRQLEKGRKLATVEQAAAFAEILGHSRTQFVRLAFKAQLHRAGLDYEISIR